MDIKPYYIFFKLYELNKFIVIIIAFWLFNSKSKKGKNLLLENMIG